MRLMRRRKLVARADDKVILAAILFLCAALFSALVQADVKSVEGLEFTSIQLLGSNELEIAQGVTTVLKIRADADDLEPLPFRIKGETLWLGVTAQGRSVADVKYKVIVPRLAALWVEGSGEAFVKPLAVDDLMLVVEGSGSIRLFDVQALELEMRVLGSGEMQAVGVTATDARLNLKGSGAIQLGSLQADVARVHIAGSGDIAIEDGGAAGFAEVRVMGSGDVSLKKLTAREADVTIMGSGNVHLGVEETLEVEIMGSGDLVYHGSPTTSSSVVGSGDVIQRD